MTDFNDAIRRGYNASRAKSARRIPTRDPAELDAQDVRTAAIFDGATVEDADAIARRHSARHGDDFGGLLRNDYKRAMTRRKV